MSDDKSDLDRARELAGVRRANRGRWPDELVLRTFLECHGNRAEVARRLGCSYMTVHARIQRLTKR